MGRKKKETQQPLPSPRWEATPENLRFRIERAIAVANENLEGYSAEDIQFIWVTITPGLFFEEEVFYKNLGVMHPPIDRLFDLAFDIDVYINTYMEGEIEPSTICAVYALKTAQFALKSLEQDSADSLVGACLMCIDAWRALSFIKRASYLYRKYKRKYTNILRSKSARKISKSNVGYDEDYLYLKDLVYDEYISITSAQTGNKNTTSTDESDLAIKILERLIQKGRILDDGEELSMDQVVTMIEDFDKNSKYAAEKNIVKKFSWVITEKPLVWPAKKKYTQEEQKDESFAGEFKEYCTGNDNKFSNLVKQRLILRDEWGLTSYPAEVKNED